MQHTISLNDEEVEVLAAVLQTELAESRVELRHTTDRNFRDQVRLRISLEQAVMDKLDCLASHPSRQAAMS